MTPNLTDEPRAAATEHTNGDGRLLTAGNLAARWQLPRSWVYAATRDGRIPTVRLGRYRRYRLDAIEEFEREGGLAA
jgi:excisionase family DNA binding protein